MGGKKGGPVLNSWIKEFCTLVFIQTIQAFIYAIIISIIVEMSFLSIEDVDDRNASMGIICVVALTAVFKVEELIKKIFGIGNSKADVHGAMSSLAKTAIAWNFGKRVLDNTTKVAGGIKSRQDAAKGRQKLKSRMERDQATFGIGGAVPDEAMDDIGPQIQQERLGAETSNAVDLGSYVGTTHFNNQAIEVANKKSQAGNNVTKNGKNIRDYNAMMDKYQDQLDELKKKRQEGTKQILRGLGETAGAVPGALAGAVIGGADGDLDAALRGAAVGIGIGDTIGGNVAEGAYTYGAVATSVPSKGKAVLDEVKRIKKALSEQEIDGKGLIKAKNYATAAYKEATRNRVSEKELQAMIKKANEASADNAN